jgi:hypothetical protein
MISPTKSTNSEEEHVEDPSVDERIILKWILEGLDKWGSIDWIDMDQDRESWRAVVRTEMNLRVS